ncbi:MAG: hypothetical protein NTV79_12065 [Candidatus Aureabacteria bacterium]|nr:hypothetical protein [Candidatus Auribacterota bacterium]
MATERLSQLQKVILLTAGEYLREWGGDVVIYNRLNRMIARRANLIHERSRWLLPRFLSAVSRSVRNLEKKGLITLAHKHDCIFTLRPSPVLKSLALTRKGKKILRKLQAGTELNELPWVKRNREKGIERRKGIMKFERQLAELGIRLPR